MLIVSLVADSVFSSAARVFAASCIRILSSSSSCSNVYDLISRSSNLSLVANSAPSYPLSTEESPKKKTSLSTVFFDGEI